MDVVSFDWFSVRQRMGTRPDDRPNKDSLYDKYDFILNSYSKVFSYGAASERATLIKLSLFWWKLIRFSSLVCMGHLSREIGINQTKKETSSSNRLIACQHTTSCSSYRFVLHLIMHRFD